MSHTQFEDPRHRIQLRMHWNNIQHGVGYIIVGILFVIPFILMSFAEEYREKKGEWRKMDGLLYLSKPSDKF